MWKPVLVLLFLALASTSQAVDKMGATQLIALAKSNPPGLRDAITSSFDAKNLKEGTAWLGHGPDFFFAIDNPAQSLLVTDDGAAQPMQHLTGSGSDLWYAIAHIEPLGKSHTFHYLVNGAKFGGSLDLPAFWTTLVSAAWSPNRHTLSHNHARQQELRWHEERILDLCPCAIRSEDAHRVHGLPGQGLVHHS